MTWQGGEMPILTRQLGLTIWRLTVAGSALTGVWLASRQFDVWWTALSQLGSLVAGVCYLGLAMCSLVMAGRLERASAWMRGALATLMLVIAPTFLVMQHGNIFDSYSVFEHLLTPVLVVTDYLLVGAGGKGVRWWHPLSWVLPPAAYLGYYIAGDLRVYVDLDPSRPEQFTANTVLLLALLLVAGFGLYAADRRRVPQPAAGASSVECSTAPSMSRSRTVIARVAASMTTSPKNWYPNAGFATSADGAALE